MFGREKEVIESLLGLNGKLTAAYQTNKGKEAEQNKQVWQNIKKAHETLIDEKIALKLHYQKIHYFP